MTQGRRAYRAIAYRCPTCNAAAGEPCRTVTARGLRGVHRSRAVVKLAHQLELFAAERVEGAPGGMKQRWFGPCENCGRRADFLAYEPGSSPPRKVCGTCYERARRRRRRPAEPKGR